MTKLPMLRAKDIEKILFHLGFQKMRQKGSHVFYKHDDGRATTVPFHAGRDITRPLLRAILNDIRLSVGDFLKHL